MSLISTFLFSAVVWHYWVAPPLVLGGVLMAINLGVGYVRKVSAHRAPPPKR